MSVIAVDPGNTESAYVHIDDDYRPVMFGKQPNELVREILRGATWFEPIPAFTIEMIASYGMAVGKDVFETCVWVGRFAETIDIGLETRFHDPETARLVYRRDIKLHFCGNPRAKDANITQALIDRFASGQPNRGKGTKANPGFFYGFHSDIWAAFALAVYVADIEARRGAA